MNCDVYQDDKLNVVMYVILTNITTFNLPQLMIITTIFLLLYHTAKNYEKSFNVKNNVMFVPIVIMKDIIFPEIKSLSRGKNIRIFHKLFTSKINFLHFLT